MRKRNEALEALSCRAFGEMTRNCFDESLRVFEVRKGIEKWRWVQDFLGFLWVLFVKM